MYLFLYFSFAFYLSFCISVFLYLCFIFSLFMYLSYLFVFCFSSFFLSSCISLFFVSLSSRTRKNVFRAIKGQKGSQQAVKTLPHAPCASTSPSYTASPDPTLPLLASTPPRRHTLTSLHSPAPIPPPAPHFRIRLLCLFLRFPHYLTHPVFCWVISKTPLPSQYDLHLTSLSGYHSAPSTSLPDLASLLSFSLFRNTSRTPFSVGSYKKQAIVLVITM